MLRQRVGIRQALGFAAARTVRPRWRSLPGSAAPLIGVVGSQEKTVLQTAGRLLLTDNFSWEPIRRWVLESNREQGLSGILG